MIKGDRILNVGTPAGGGVSIIANDPVSGGDTPSVFPPVTTNLAYHLDAQTGIYSDAGVTEATNGQAIQQINDQSGNGITGSQTTAGEQSTYAVASLNGKNTIRNLLSTTLDLGGQYVFHFLYKKDATTDKAVIIGSGTKYIFDNSNDYFYGPNTIFYNGGHILDYSVMTLVVDETGDNTMSLYQNGIKIGTVVSNTTSTISFDALFNRALYTSTGEFNIGDIVAYSALQSNDDMESIVDGMNTKYGEVYLPKTDASTPPTVGTTTLEWYHNPDLDTYSDMGFTAATNLDFIRGAKTSEGAFTSLSQDIAANQMQFKNTVLPNSKASYYKGGADYMNMSDAKVFTASESFVAYSVHKKNADGTNAIFGQLYSAYNTIMEWSLGRVYFGDAGGVTSVNVTTTTDTVVRAYVIDRTAQLLRVYQNGSQVATVDITARNQSATFDIMFNRNTLGNGQIDHGITLLYRGLHSATDVGTVSDWLNAYYGDLIY
jgi:hypothetical protein